MFKQRISRWITQFNAWRESHLTRQQFLLLISIPTGFSAGLAAIVIKKLAHYIRDLVTGITIEYSHLLYFIFPAVGILLTICFCKFILRKEIGHGIPGILYSIRKNKGKVSKHSMWSTIIASALTVGFGGSVGLEGPSVSTGASIGSNIGR